MNTSRLAIAGLAVVASTVMIACSSDDGNAPDTLPSYEYDGPKGPSTMFELGVASGDPTSSAVILWTHASSGSTKPCRRARSYKARRSIVQ